jgi:polyisoprenoid-binding protein YceI
MLHRVLAALLLALAFAPPVAAERLALDLDPAHSSASVRFGATFHSVSGFLGPAHGRIAFDTRTGDADGDVVLAFDDARTGNSRRDSKMHHKILQTDLYPLATFHVERVNLPRPLHQGRNDLQLVGRLDFHGTTRPFALPASADLAGDRVTASAEVEVPYIAWGLADPSFLFLRVAKVVTVEITAAGALSGSVPRE